MSRRYSLPAVRRILVRRRWFVLVPFALGLAAAGPIGGLAAGPSAEDAAVATADTDPPGSGDRHDDSTPDLDAQVDEAKQRLTEQEAAIDAFRQRQASALGARVQRQQQALERARLDVDAASRATAEAREHRELLEQMLAQERARRPPSARGAMVDESPAPMTLAQQLALTKAQQELNRVRLGADHPDVITMDRAILELETRLAQDTSLPVPASPLDGDVQTLRIRDLEADLGAADGELEARVAEEARARQALARTAAEPVAAEGEAELLALTEEYGALRLAYASLLTEQEEARTARPRAAPLTGEPVTSPATAVVDGHARRRLAAMAAAPVTGLLMGLLLVAWVEHRDDRFRSEVDVTRALALPVLGVVSEMTTDDERVGQRRRTLALDAAGVVVLLGSIAVLAFWRFEV